VDPVVPFVGHHSRLTCEIARLKIVDVMAGNYWIPERERWLSSGPTIAQIIERVDFCGVWGMRQ
jgi:hypothetical protein